MANSILWWKTKTTSRTVPQSEIAVEVPHINSFAVKGELWTGYEDGGDKGDFECENCTYYDRDTSSCGQADMVMHSKKVKLAGSDRIVVDPEGCCEYVDRKGLVDKDKE